MRSSRQAPGAALAVLVGVAGVAGCASAPRPVRPGPSAPVTPAVPDASLDWRQLIAAPFASTLKELPFPVHEVLEFGAAARPGSSGGPAPEECFRPDGQSPRFLGRGLDDYVLCFRRDRLARIEAGLRLDTGGAEADFARYCDGWLKNATLIARSEANCRGREGDIAFEARLDEDRSQTTTSMSMILSRDPDESPSTREVP
jgi:hypothetical protein